MIHSFLKTTVRFAKFTSLIATVALTGAVASNNARGATVRAHGYAAGNDQVCVGGFIFDWCDEYWKSGHNDTQVGGPNRNFLGGAFAGGYADEAGYGVTGSVNESTYGPGKPNISRTLFKGYDAVKAFYNASSQASFITARTKP